MVAVQVVRLVCLCMWVVRVLRVVRVVLRVWVPSPDPIVLGVEPL